MADVSLAKLTDEMYLQTLATDVFTCTDQDWDSEAAGNLELESQIPIILFYFQNHHLHGLCSPISLCILNCLSSNS